MVKTWNLKFSESAGMRGYAMGVVVLVLFLSVIDVYIVS